MGMRFVFLRLLTCLFSLPNISQHLISLLNQTSEPLIPSVQKLNLITIDPTSSPPPPKTVPDYLALNKKHQDILTIYNNIWKEHQLDAIIMPPAPHTAVSHDTWGTVSYTVLWNLLDYPGFVIPVGKVEERDVVENGRKFYSQEDEELYKLCK